MSKRDYELIARVLRATGQHNATDETYREGWHGALASVVHRFAGELAGTNPRFDRERFIAAATA